VASLFRASAQTKAPAPTDPKPTAILAGRLIDVRSGHVSTKVYIIVEKDRIARIAAKRPRASRSSTYLISPWFRA
jgi:hypothetical protein